MNANTVLALPQNLAGVVSATETAVPAVVGGTTRAILSLPNDVNGGYFDGKPFKLRVVAKGVATGTTTFTVNVYWNVGTNTNLTTFTNDVLVIGNGGNALASKAGNILMETILIWDSTLQSLVGFWNESAGVAAIVTTPVVLKTTSAVTATSPITATGVATVNAVQFFVTFTSSTAANQTSATLVELAIDRY